jgi:hypothetical protein
MSDDRAVRGGGLGQTLVVIGVLWVGLALAAGLGALDSLGLGVGGAADVGRSIVPALFVVVIGNSLRRRRKVADGEAGPVQRVTLSRTPPLLDKSMSVPKTGTVRRDSMRPVVGPDLSRSDTGSAASSGRPSSPSESPMPGAEPVESEGDGGQPEPLAAPEPKSSKELIDDAWRKWGKARGSR